jgi:hypothetical protein
MKSLSYMIAGFIIFAILLVILVGVMGVKESRFNDGMEELRKIRDEVSSENIILKKENVRLNSELELSLVNNLANLALLEVLQNNSDLIEQLNSFTLVSQIETVKHKEAIMTLNEQISMLEEGTIQNFCSLVEMNIFASDGSENFVGLGTTDY